MVAASVATSYATVAHAQDATTLVRQGVVARREGRDADALALFQRAEQSDPRASTRAQVGFALQALGRWVEAEEQLARVAALDDPWVVRHRDVLDAALATVRQHVGSLELDCAPAGAEVLIDGRTVGVAPLAQPLRLAAGRVTVTVRLEGHYPSERVFTIQEGDRARERDDRASPARGRAPAASHDRCDGHHERRGCRLAAARAALDGGCLCCAAPRRDAEPKLGRSDGDRQRRRRERRRRTGVASVAAGSDRAADGARVQRDRGITFECDPTNVDIAAAQREHGAAQSSSTASAGLIVAGAVTAVGGAVWLLVDRLTAPRAEATAPRARVSVGAFKVRF